METPDEKQLAVHTSHDFEVFDLADEEQILAELGGRVTEKFVYELKGVKDPITGLNVTGLSYAGTNWACREYAKHGEVIRVIGKPEVIVDPTDPNYIVVVITAQRFAVNSETQRETPLDTNFGVKRQWRLMKKNKYENGQVVGEEIVQDPFFFEKAFSKSIRNAKQSLIPTDVVKQLIQRAIKAKQSGPARDSGSTPPKAPPAAPAKAAAPRKSVV